MGQTKSSISRKNYQNDIQIRPQSFIQGNVRKGFIPKQYNHFFSFCFKQDQYQKLKPLQNQIYDIQPGQFQQEAIINIDVEMKKIQNFQYPYSCIGLLNINFPSSSGAGTGFLIYRNIILTCAHNVYNRKRKQKAKSVSFYPGLNGRKGDKFQCAFAFYPKQFQQQSDPKSGQYDYAIVVLNIKSLSWNYGFLELNSNFNQTLIATQQFQITGYCPQSKVGNSQFFMFQSNGKIAKIEKTENKRIMHLINTQQGMSGSPIMRKVGKYYEVIGIHTHGLQLRINKGVPLSKDIIIKMNNWIRSIQIQSNQKITLMEDNKIRTKQIVLEKKFFTKNLFSQESILGQIHCQSYSQQFFWQNNIIKGNKQNQKIEKLENYQKLVLHQNNPDQFSINKLHKKAQIQYIAHNYQKSLKYLYSYKLCQRNLDFLFLITLNYQKLCKYKQSIDYLKKMYQRDVLSYCNQDYKAFICLVQIINYYRLGKFKIAQELLYSLIKHCKLNKIKYEITIQIQTYLLSVYRINYQYEKAKKKAIEISDLCQQFRIKNSCQYFYFLIQEGLLYDDLKKYEEAQKNYSTAEQMKLFSNQKLWLLSCKGKHQQYLKNYQLAIKLYQEAEKIFTQQNGFLRMTYQRKLNLQRYNELKNKMKKQQMKQQHEQQQLSF